MTDAPRVEVVAAALRRDLDDLDLYAAFLESTLTTALPAELLQIERKQSLGDRMKGRPGSLVRMAVTIGDHRYLWHAGGRRPRTEVVHVVRGLELDHDELPLDAWITRLATALSSYAEGSARAAEALARITDPFGTL